MLPCSVCCCCSCYCQCFTVVLVVVDGCHCHSANVSSKMKPSEHEQNCIACSHCHCVLRCHSFGLNWKYRQRLLVSSTMDIHAPNVECVTHFHIFVKLSMCYASNDMIFKVDVTMSVSDRWEVMREKEFMTMRIEHNVCVCWCCCWWISFVVDKP